MANPIFDYVKQAWVIDGKYIRCGHPESMSCGCYGRIHEGEVATDLVDPRFSDPAYAKCERSVSRAERRIQRAACALGIVFVSLGHSIPCVKPASPVYVSLGQSQYQVPVSVPAVVNVKLGVR